MKPYIYIAGLLFFLQCSTNIPKHPIINVDLDRANDTINYSTFTSSLDYIELNTNDSCLLSDIEKIYLDDDTFLIWDKKKAGILTFTHKGEFVKQINYYGEGPEEFITIKAFCIDPMKNLIYIWDYPSHRINKYTYNGTFVESEKSELFVRDFTIWEDGNKLCILPFSSQSLPYGVWVSDPNNNILKKYDIFIPEDHIVEYSGTYYNISRNGIFYYDRNWDHIHIITRDTSQLLYSFNIPQVLAPELRTKDPSTLPNLDKVAYMTNFSVSDNYILQTYHYRQEDPTRWVLFNRKNNTVSVVKRLHNDIDNIQTDYPHVYYLNDSTWCRIIETDANNCNILLQIIHM